MKDVAKVSSCQVLYSEILYNLVMPANPVAELAGLILILIVIIRNFSEIILTHTYYTFVLS